MSKEKVKKPIFKRVWFWILVVVVVFAAIGALGGGGDSSGETTADPQTPIEYTVVSVDEMMSLLSENALNATDTYDDQYVEVTGNLSVIDSSGSYISLYPENDPYAFMGVQCYIKSDEQAEVVKTLKKDQSVTVRGKITGVGEVLGYTLDIDSFVQ